MFKNICQRLYETFAFFDSLHNARTSNTLPPKYDIIYERYLASWSYQTGIDFALNKIFVVKYMCVSFRKKIKSLLLLAGRRFTRISSLSSTAIHLLPFCSMIEVLVAMCWYTNYARFKYFPRFVNKLVWCCCFHNMRNIDLGCSSILFT